MRLTPGMEIALEEVASLHADIVLGKRLLRQKIEQEFAKQQEALLRRQSRAANRALALGVPKTRVGRALGTADWKSIQSILELTADEFDAPANIGQGAWTFNQKTLTVTFHTQPDGRTPLEEPITLRLRWHDGRDVTLPDGQVAFFPNSNPIWVYDEDAGFRYPDVAWMKYADDVLWKIRATLGVPSYNRAPITPEPEPTPTTPEQPEGPLRTPYDADQFFDPNNWQAQLAALDAEEED